MDRKKCRGIIKKVSTLLLVQIVEVLQEEIAREKKVWVRKWLARRMYTWWISITFKITVTEDPAEYRVCLRMSPECFDTLHDLIANATEK
jgi:hypothetical protein